MRFLSGIIRYSVKFSRNKMKASAQSSRSFFCMGATYTYNKFFSCHRQSFRAPFGEGAAIKGIDTYAKHVCWRRRDRGRRLRRPAKKHEETFPFSRFLVTKSSKSHLRGLSSLLKNTLRVHELVARSSAWQVRAAKVNGASR